MNAKMTNRILVMTAALSVVLTGGAKDLTLTAKDVEVVAAADAPQATLLAVQEMTNALNAVFGAEVPFVREPTAGKKHVFLGANEWTAKAGIDVKPLKRDGFRMVVKGEGVFIAGRDDPKAKVLERIAQGGDSHVEQATVNGVYEFLERYAGVRYYFPGPLGTILPKAKALKVPEGDFTSEPDYSVRYHTTYIHGAVPETILPAAEVASALALHERRMRIDTERIPCCHGQYQSKLPQRFAKTHPEYFCLKKDGTRRDTDPEKPPLSDYAHVCLTSDVWEEIYKDARSYLKGEPASVRGMLRGKAPNYRTEWGWHAVGGKYYDIMPHDGILKCWCARCQAAYAKAKDPKDWANELVWGRTAEIGNRLKAEGIKGYVTQMAYSPYKNVPDVELPDNVRVMVAQRGPWDPPERMAKDRELARKWGEKTHGAVWIWTYVGKFGDFTNTMDWFPCGTPRAMGRYWKAMRGIIFGGYSEEETDRYLQHYLDLYVFAKVCWNLETDVEALLAEHNRLMFGAAAKPMDMIIRIMEECWLRIASNTEDTALGPSIKAPTEEQLYTKYYGPKVIARLDALYAEAASLVPAGSLEARRIALYRDEFYAVIRQRANDYHESSDVPRWRKFVEEHPELVVKGRFVRRSGTAEMDADGRGFSLAADPAKEFSTVSARMPSFEYGKRYRLAWFIRAEDVKAADKWGGLIATFRRGNDFKEDALRAPRSGSVVGTTDWIRQTIEFTPAENVKESGRFTQELNFNIVRATGRFRVRDITVEEIR